MFLGLLCCRGLINEYRKLKEFERAQVSRKTRIGRLHRQDCSNTARDKALATRTPTNSGLRMLLATKQTAAAQCSLFFLLAGAFTGLAAGIADVTGS